MSVLTKCVHCPRWQVEVADDAARERVEEKHRQRLHPALIPTAPGVIGAPPASSRESADWRTQALDGLAQLAETRSQFTVFDVADLGVPEPPDPAHDWGHLTRDAKHLGLITPVKNPDGSDKAVPSKRPATKGSLVKVWQRGGGRRTA